MQLSALLLVAFLALVGSAHCANFTGNFANPGGPPDAVGVWMIDGEGFLAVWIEGLDSFSAVYYDGVDGEWRPDGGFSGPIPYSGIMHSWECDPERGPGAFKIAETVTYRWANGTIAYTDRYCAIGKVDLEAGTQLSALNWDGDECPTEYDTTAVARLVNTTLVAKELVCKGDL